MLTAEQPPNPAHQIPGDEQSHTTGTDNGTESGAENTATDADPAASNTPAGDPELATWRRSRGCPDDAVVLAGHPHAPPPPMSTPEGMGGLIVDMLDLAVDDNRVVAFAASWIPEPMAGDRTLYGEVYALLAARLAGHSHVHLDGTLIYTDRCHAPGPTPGGLCKSPELIYLGCR